MTSQISVPLLIRISQFILRVKLRIQIAKAMKGGYAVITDGRKRETARANINNWKWFFKMKGGIENVPVPPGSKKIEFYSVKRQLLFRYDL